MKIEVIDLYKNEFDVAYLHENKDSRKRVSMFSKDKSRKKWMSYARYVWETNTGEKVPDNLEVDHINEDKTDDRFENLQLLSKKDNTVKTRKLKPRRFVDMVCPICGKTFKFEERNLSTHKNPCCSRTCGYKKGVLSRKLGK